jgi:hypothetical protein
MEMVTMEIDKPIYNKLEALAKQKGWASPYAYLVEIILQKSKEQELRGCPHCRNNPRAQKPFLKMKKLPMDPDFRKHLEETSKPGKQSLDCFVCEIIQDFAGAFRDIEA